MRILVVDDESAVRNALRRAFALAGYDVALAENGEVALGMLIQSGPPDAVVLDVLMPGTDGIEVCRRMRAAGDRTPVLMLTARETVADRVAGLDAGADDYLVKPFDLDELLARVRALLRRSSNGDTSMLRFADVELDRGAREAARGERRIDLTRTEFSLLELFMRHPRQVLTRSQIYERVWDYDFGPLSNSLSVYIGYLRRKLEADGEPRVIQTVRGTGYVLREPVR
jgi:two-component system response regulator MprA